MANVNKAAVTKKILAFLIAKAIDKETTTYEEVAIAHGLPDSGSQLGQVLSPILYDILDACRANGWPPLTSIVVRKSGADKGLPGAGFWSAFELKSVLDREIKITLCEVFHIQVFEYFGIMK